MKRIALILLCAAPGTQTAALGADRPNILWITCEDMSPDLGCYGDSYSHSPTLDRLARQGVRYTSAFSISGVCAPSRSALITGMYPSTISTHHMRCKAVPPPYVKCFTEYLRAAGYYCTNNVKTDYNFDAPITAWDECSRQAHWRKRPRKDQPFFSVFNLPVTHESRIRAADKDFARMTQRLKSEQRHDPDKAVLPPYYPDTPIVRNDWARYYDLITAMDLQVADILKQLEEDGLADSTIVFFYADHGRGLPRAKRWIYDSGLHVPLIVRFPDGSKADTVREDLVSFVDFGPTALSLAGVKVPEYMQGRPFLGDQKAEPRDYVFAARDRMDETYDIIRGVRDKRYKYIRNFKPGRPYAQYIGYMELMPTMQEMRRLNKAGKLEGAQKLYFLPEKPTEELYDLTADPHEVNNLAGSPEHKATLERMRARLGKWMKDTNDLGLIPEEELNERMRPSGKWETTAPLVFGSQGGNANDSIVIQCATEGASIAYTTDTGDKLHWKLYISPLKLKPGTTIRAKAIRLGFKESPVARLAVPGS